MDRWLHVVYCDDIRQEAGNKRSFMGVYQADLFVPTIPIVLPRLCIAAFIYTFEKDPFKSVTLQLFRGDDTLVEAPIEHLNPDTRVESPAIKGAVGERFNVLVAELALTPYEVTEPHRLRVRVKTEKGEIKGTALAITQSPT
jgi:hypothetical protein